MPKQHFSTIAHFIYSQNHRVVDLIIEFFPRIEEEERKAHISRISLVSYFFLKKILPDDSEKTSVINY